MAVRMRSRLSCSAACRGSTPSRADASRTCSVLLRMRCWISSKTAAWVAPWYSIAAQMTPPAFAMKSGTLITPRVWSACSASEVIAMLAPETTSRARSESALPAFSTSGRAAGTQISQLTATSSSGVSCFASAYSVTLRPSALSASSCARSSPRSAYTAPLESATATVTHPSSARKRAVGRPTLP